ncbi:MAG: chromosomal replication initiator protein DnaA [Candidatus Sumerlaeota bacterium]|nr:chromosomal replication initiator protein DnaA [Candidatus Sumerlaeota bacterium]
MISSGNLWDRALVQLKDIVDTENFNMWLRPTRQLSQTDDQLQVEVPSVHFKDWLSTHYTDHINAALAQIGSAPVSIQFVVGDEAVHALSKDEVTAAQNLQGLEAFETPINGKYSFEHFIVGESNRFAHAAAVAVADPNSKAYNPLFIYGGSGVGKTHLMHAIGLQMRSAAPRLRVLYATSEQFFNSFINSINKVYYANGSGKSDPNAFRSVYRNVDLLMIDDIQFFIGKEGTQNEFFHTFNALYDAGKKIVISSDRPPMELTTLEERLKSRFLWGLNVDIQPPDLETRIAILKRKAQNEGIDVTPDVIMFIAERVQTNVRHLEGALNRLQAHAALEHRKITVDLAQEALVDMMTMRLGPKLTVDEINQEVCTYFGLRLHELIGPARDKKFATARHVAMYLSRRLTGLSLPDLAARFGGRNHSTVLHAFRKVERDLLSDTNLQNIVSYIERAVRGAR